MVDILPGSSEAMAAIRPLKNAIDNRASDLLRNFSGIPFTEKLPGPQAFSKKLETRP